MKYDFNTIPNRQNSGSLKWNFQSEHKKAFPFSVADMEWKTAPQIIEAMKDFASSGYFCYTVADDAYKTVIKEFMLRRHNWQIENEWIVCTGGVVAAINTAVRAFTKIGEGVIIQPPVYYPFSNSINNNGRKIAANPLIKKDNTYVMDFDGLERLAAKEENKLMLLCSPHNPVGRVWTKDELERVADICLRNNVVLVSDEIHFDITRTPHTCLPVISKEYADNCVVCTAVSKTFNIAGLGTSNIIIPNPSVRNVFEKQLAADGYTCINCCSRPATIAAYTQCDDWIDEMNECVNKNFELLGHFCKENLPQIRLYNREGTYLAWLDMSALGMDDEILKQFLINKCGIIPDPGYWFGDEGKGFMRLDIAVPETALMQALQTLHTELSIIQ